MIFDVYMQCFFISYISVLYECTYNIHTSNVTFLRYIIFIFFNVNGRYLGKEIMTLFVLNFSVFYKNMLAVFKRKQLLALKKSVQWSRF